MLCVFVFLVLKKGGGVFGWFVWVGGGGGGGGGGGVWPPCGGWPPPPPPLQKPSVSSSFVEVLKLCAGEWSIVDIIINCLYRELNFFVNRFLFASNVRYRLRTNMNVYHNSTLHSQDQYLT